MDFSIIDARLAASNPSKPDPSHNVARYSSVQEFIADMKLVFDNCFLFNGPDHVISQCAKRLQAVFERSLKNMPPPQAVSPKQISLPGSTPIHCPSSPLLYLKPLHPLPRHLLHPSRKKSFVGHRPVCLRFVAPMKLRLRSSPLLDPVARFTLHHLKTLTMPNLLQRNGLNLRS